MYCLFIRKLKYHPYMSSLMSTCCDNLNLPTKSNFTCHLPNSLLLHEFR